MLVTSVYQTKNAEMKDLVENSRKVGEAFIWLFEFTAKDFKKKSNSLFYQKIYKTKLLWEKTSKILKFNKVPMREESEHEFDIPKIILNSWIKGR